jgi:hypothetical protein
MSSKSNNQSIFLFSISEIDALLGKLRVYVTLVKFISDILCAFDYARSDALIGREIDILHQENDIPLS